MRKTTADEVVMMTAVTINEVIVTRVHQSSLEIYLMIFEGQYTFNLTKTGD